MHPVHSQINCWIGFDLVDQHQGVAVQIVQTPLQSISYENPAFPLHINYKTLPSSVAYPPQFSLYSECHDWTTNVEVGRQ